MGNTKLRVCVTWLLIVVLLPGPILACLWDSDTLSQERQRFPSALELITGKFLRHSREFYEWRRKDREGKLATEQRPEWFDDVAVACDKLGDQEQAIAWMDRKEALYPGLYETAANRGTFLLHAGRFEAGIPEIERALTINPAAHFNRERYQLLLARYIQSRRNADGQTPMPLVRAGEDVDGVRHTFGEQPGGFLGFVLREQGLADKSESNRRYEAYHRRAKDEVTAATQGILGIMRFGNYESPLVLEALGDLLAWGENPEDAKQLAARAFLKASYAVAPTSAERAMAYRELAERVLDMQEQANGVELTLDVLERQFEEELAEAREWSADLAEQERGWIAPGSGVDPEAEFDRLYLDEPRISGFVPVASPAASGLSLLNYLLLGGVVVGLIVIGAVLGRRGASAES